MSKPLVQNTAVLLIVLGGAALATHHYIPGLNNLMNDEQRERCYGVVKAHANDCATALHSCAAQATRDSDPEEWILLPKGLCERIVVVSS